MLFLSILLLNWEYTILPKLSITKLLLSLSVFIEKFSGISIILPSLSILMLTGIEVVVVVIFVIVSFLISYVEVAISCVVVVSIDVESSIFILVELFLLLFLLLQPNNVNTVKPTGNIILQI